MHDQSFIDVNAIITHAGGIFFFGSHKERESYINWLVKQPKQQWNIDYIVNRVHKGEKHWEAAQKWLWQA